MTIVIATGNQTTDKPTILYDNQWVGDVVSSGTGENSASEYTYDFWTPDSLPATIETNFGASTIIDTVCIAAHNLGSSGTTISIERWDGSAFQVVDDHTPTDDSTIAFLFPSITTERLQISLSGAGSPSIGVVAAGARISVPTGIVPAYDPFTWNEQIEVLGGETVSGQFMGNRIRRNGRAGAANFGSVSRTWFDSDGLAFVAHFNEAKPFFFMPSPEGLPDEVGYCWRSPDNGAVIPRIGQVHELVNLSMDFRAYA